MKRPLVRMLCLTAAAGLGTAAAALGLPLGGARASAGAASAEAAKAGAASATVKVALDQGAQPIPDSFMGVSVEPDELLSFSSRPAFGRLLEQLAVPGGGPLILRVGGRSADDASWPTPGVRPRPGAYTLSSRWLAALASVVRAANVRVMLNLNLLANSPQMAGQFAAAVTHALPTGAIAAFEIGNEPDLYGYGPHATHRGYTTATYAKQYGQYARALAARRVPTVLAGPSLNGIAPAWVAAALAAGQGTLRIVTAHRYPYWAGYTRGAPGYPSINGLLSDSSTAASAARLQQEAAMTHAAGRAFRITEMGTSAGAVPGVTDTFATALWAPDALLSLANVGVDGVNVHIRARYSNSALNATGAPRPLFYGLALAARTLGPDATLLPASVTQAHGARLKAWAVRVRGNRLHLLLINRGAKTLTVSVPLPGRGAASVERLLAPSVTATTGETLGGQSLSAAGTWQGTRRTLSVPARGDTYAVTVTGRSAALLTVALR